MTDTNAALHPYADLTPDRVMDAMQDLGLWPDGRLLALSSYENPLVSGERHLFSARSQ